MSIDEKLEQVLQQIQYQNEILGRYNKLMESFSEDIEWLKGNAVTKKDLAEMVTKNDLKKEFIAEREHTRKIIQEEIVINNKVLGAIIKVELAELKREVGSVLQDHEERVTLLEEHTGLKTRKN